MNKSPRTHALSLPAQMVLRFVALVFLTTVAVGLPAIWIIYQQLERQAWALVDQGSRSTLALYTAQHNEVTSLAGLTAERPTLAQLLEQGDPQELSVYMRNLQTGAVLDLVLVCGPDRQPLANAGREIWGQVCQEDLSTGYYLAQASDGPQLWLLAAQPVRSGQASLGEVVVGRALDRTFAAEMRLRTGLDQFLLAGGRIAASSLGEVGKDWAELSLEEGSGELSSSVNPAGPPTRSSFILEGRPYYSARSQLAGAGIENVVALDVSDIAATQRRLVWTMAGGIAVVAALGSALGILMARRISQPLADLGTAADALRMGDLETTVSVPTNLPEVAVVAYALEDARSALHHTMAELRQEKAWTDHLLESVVEGILTLDQHGRVTFFSQGAERITGLKQDQVIGQSCDSVFRPVEPGERFSQLIPPPGGRQKVSLSLRGGRQVTLAITGARLAPPEAGKARVALVLRDVSDEEAIRRLLGDFLANISHEFRTPLSALDASIELLLDQLPDLTPAELQELLNSLHLGILSLQTLIDNLLEGASIETGRFRVYPRTVELGEIVGEGSRVMQPLLDKYNQRLVIHLPEGLPSVQADSRRTVQVLVNLISNAIKYGPAEAEILLAVTLGEDGVKVSVADRGPGISPDHQAGLFRRFVHLGSGTEKAQYGVGLGLSVVKAIVEAQGGQVGAENRPDGGAVFWFTLPVVVEEEPSR